MSRIRRDGDRLILHVRLTPKGGRNAIDGWAVGADGRPHLKARVSAPPQDGSANDALIALLAKSLGIAKGKVVIVAGATARLKTVAIAQSDVAARLEHIGDLS